MSKFPPRPNTNNHTQSVSGIRAMIFLLILLIPTGAVAGKNFPLSPAIRPNVQFWTQIYAHHSVNSAVIHDRRDLSKIYGTIDLLDRELPGADRLNKAYLKATEKKFTAILLKLAKGKPPGTSEERKVAALFTGPDRLKKMKQASSQVRSQSGLKERFREGVVRSGAYIDRLKWIFRSHGLPQDLAYLPHVESSFHTGAYSKFGAAGMWQFTRATGKQYMVIDEAVDERLDPYISGKSAAQYLKNSYNNLGNWPMAITAYNYGTAGMMRAKKELGTYDNIFRKYQKGHFGFASRNFYAEFLAALAVAKKLEQDRNVRPLPPQVFTEIRLPGYMSAAAAISHFKVSSKQLRELNPALKKSVFEGRKYIPRGYSLRLPDRQDITRLAKSIPRSSTHNNQIRDREYKVRNGDTAGGIAYKHGISVKELIAANSLDRSATIYIGQRLKLPSRNKKGKQATNVAYLPAKEKKQFAGNGTSPDSQLSAGNRTIPLLADSKKQKPGQAAAPILVKTGGKREKITVQPEESLSLYAFWLKLPEAKLRKENKLNSLDQIHPGQQITVLYDKVTAAEFAEQRAEFLHENEMDFFAAFKVVELKPYRVANGDTLWNLCNKQFNIPLWLLKKYNRELSFSDLHLGQELTIPVVRAL